MVIFLSLIKIFTKHYVQLLKTKSRLIKNRPPHIEPGSFFLPIYENVVML
jgi:hypothetical protein